MCYLSSAARTCAFGARSRTTIKLTDIPTVGSLCLELIDELYSHSMRIFLNNPDDTIMWLLLRVSSGKHRSSERHKWDFAVM